MKVDKYSINKEILAKLVGDGKITIPKELRDAYNIQRGDILVIEVKEVIKVKKRSRN